MAIAYVALGSNLGDRRGKLSEAIGLLRAMPRSRVVAVAKTIETPAEDAPAGSGPFLNTVAAVETQLDPESLLEELLNIERMLGRERKAGDVKNGPRVIDLDLLLHGGAVTHSTAAGGGRSGRGLTLPHPRMHLRRFVLEPLAEIAPATVHPVLKKTVAELLRELPAMRESA